MKISHSFIFSDIPKIPRAPVVKLPRRPLHPTGLAFATWNNTLLFLFFIFFWGFLKAPDSPAAWERSAALMGAQDFRIGNISDAAWPRQDYAAWN